MTSWLQCKSCAYAREFLLELPCCGSMFCSECLNNKGRCPKCVAVFDLARCKETRSIAQWMDMALATCPNEGCDHKCSPILMGQHTLSCPHALPTSDIAVSLLSSLEDEHGPTAVAEKRSRNLFKPFLHYANVRLIAQMTEADPAAFLYPKDVLLHSDKPKVGERIKHIIMDTDTLPGIALQYGSTPSEIKKLNGLTCDQIHMRAFLYVIVRKEPVVNQTKEELEAMLLRKLVHKLRRETGVKETEEALYYLEEANYDLAEALSSYRSDLAWAAGNAHPLDANNNNNNNNTHSSERDYKSKHGGRRGCGSCLASLLTPTSAMVSVR